MKKVKYTPEIRERAVQLLIESEKDYAGFTPLELAEYLIENPEALNMLEQQSRKNGYSCGIQQELVKIVEVLEQAIPLKC